MTRKNKNTFLVLSLLMALVLTVTACVPGGSLPTTGGQGQQATSAVDEDTDGSTIPQTGDVGQTTPGAEGGLQGEDSDPTGRVARISVNEENVQPGGEIVVSGQGFEGGVNIRIFAGRPEDAGGNEPLVTTQTDDNGEFSAHLVLPMEFGAGAVTAGQLLLTATAGDSQEVAAMTVVQTGTGGESGEGEGNGGNTGGQGTGNQGTGGQGSVDLSQLDFEVNEAVLPVINNQLGTDFGDDEMVVTNIEEREWENGCLGLGEADEMCTTQIVNGYRLTVEVDGNTYFIRTSEDGSQVRMESVQGGTGSR